MFKPDDLDDLSRLYADAEVMKYLSGHPLSRDETADWLNYFLQGWEQYGFGWWAVVLREPGELIGHCGLQFIHTTPEIEVTYGLAKAYWRMGLASEAARACLRYGFEELKLDRIYALADPGNVDSHRVMERAGMTYDKTAFYKDNLFEGDLFYYAMARNQYRPDISPFNLRPTVGDEGRISFTESFAQRQREWRTAQPEN